MTGPADQPADHSVVDAPATGDADPVVSAAETRVQRALDDLVGLADANPDEQVEAFSSAQRTLQATLSDIDND